MVEVFGAGTTMHFNPKDLGLNAGIWDCFEQFRLNLWTVFGQSEAEFFGLFWAVPRLILGLLLVHVCHLCVIAKMNIMCSYENHVVICSIEVLAWIV